MHSRKLVAIGVVATLAASAATGAFWESRTDEDGQLRGKTIISLNAYPSQLSPEEATRLASSGVVGTVVELEPPQWSTPDGTAPAPEDRGKEPFVIFRTATVRVDEVIFGSSTPSIRIPVVGGAVGDSVMAVDQSEMPQVAVGDQVALFLIEPPAGWQIDRSVLAVVQRYSVHEGQATAGTLPAVALQELKARARSAAGDAKLLPQSP